MHVWILHDVYKIRYISIIKWAKIMLRLPLESGDLWLSNGRWIKFVTWIVPEIMTFKGRKFKIEISKISWMTIFWLMKAKAIMTSHNQKILFFRARYKMSTYFWQEEGFGSYSFPYFCVKTSITFAHHNWKKLYN